MSASGHRVRSWAAAQDLIFISAQLPGKSGSPKEQLDEVVAKLTEVLREAGAGPADVVKVGMFYHRSLIDTETDLLSRLAGCFPSDLPPVVTAIPLHVIPQGALLQLEAIALRPDGRRWSARRPLPSSGDLSRFSRAMRCGDLVIAGAQMPVDDAGTLQHHGDIVGQARVTIANLRSALEGAGGGLDSVVKLNTYYVGQGTTEDWSTAARIRSDAFRKPGPGATGVPVPGPYPRGMLLRQEAIAVTAADGLPAPRRTAWPRGVWDWPIPVSFEQGIAVNGLIFTGGQIAATTTGEALFPGRLFDQAVNVMGCISAILGGLGHNVDCLRKVTIFYATGNEPADAETVLAAITPFFANGLPAITLVPLARLGLTGIEIEIEGIGVEDAAA